MALISKLLAVIVLLAGCIAQDILISPQDSFTISINESRPISEQYLIEVDSQKYVQEWAAFVAQCKSHKSSTIVQIQFSVVFKEDPTQIYQKLNKCRFEGEHLQWCKIGQRTPPLNIHHHLIKASIQCPNSCQFDLVFAHTQSKWDGKDSPKQFGSHQSTSQTTILNQFSMSKYQAMLKIGGWMLFTLMLVLGAIQIAVRVADWIDQKSALKDGRRKID